MILLSRKWLSDIFKHQELDFYARLFDESESFPFAVHPIHSRAGMRIKPPPGAPKLYILKYNKSSCVFFLLSPVFFYFGEKLQQIILKKRCSIIWTQNIGLKFDVNVEMVFKEIRYNHGEKYHIKYKQNIWMWSITWHISVTKTDSVYGHYWWYPSLY